MPQGGEDAAYIEKIAVKQTAAIANPRTAPPIASVSLPKTATDARLYIAIGLLLLLANVWLVALAWRRERRRWE
jgi:LPXTG-motif cell wall-anchored protein